MIATPKAVSNNMIVSHTEGFAVSLECAPDEAFWITPDDGLIVHANHWSGRRGAQPAEGHRPRR